MARARIHVGTSGWTYDDWAGVFYPPGVRAAERLAFYAERFDAVEVNATFYRHPTGAMVAAWNRRLGEGFHLAVKGSRVVTHHQKLMDVEEPLRAFLERVLPLKRLKVILWQLPPSLHKDAGRLEGFLGALPREVRHAVEFRHPSWWDEEVGQVLSRHGAAFTAVSHPRLPGDVFATAKFLYLRFHGLGRRLYDYDYSDEELAGWAGRLRLHLPGRELYAFFNNSVGGQAVGNAQRFREMLEAGEP